MLAIGDAWNPDRVIVLTSSTDTIEKHIRQRNRPHESAENMVRRFRLIDGEFRRLAPLYPNTIVIDRDRREFHERGGLMHIIGGRPPPFQEIRTGRSSAERSARYEMRVRGAVSGQTVGRQRPVLDQKMPRRYWLMKCEPAAYTIADLERDGRTSWEGVRNYQARNFMRDDMQEGDGVLFYASNADPSGVTGLATIVRAAYPDHFAVEERAQVFRSGQQREGADLVHGGHRLRRAISRGRVPRRAEGDPRTRTHDGQPEGQPPVGAARRPSRSTPSSSGLVGECERTASST